MSDIYKAGGGGGAGSVNFSAGAQSANLTAVTFANGSGVSFGLNAGTITATVQTNYLTSQSNQNVTADNGGFAFQTLSFSNANNFTFATSAGNAIVGSYTVPTVTNSSWTVSDSATSGTVGRLAFTNLNGVTLSLSSGTGGLHTIVGSHNALTSQSNQAFSADAMSNFQTLVFQDSNGVSFSNNAGSLRVTHGLQFTSATSAITSNALHSSASRVINIVAATNNTAGGTASLSSNVSFSAANGLTFYTSAGGAVVGSHNGITIQSVESQSLGMSNLGNTSGTTGIASGGQVQFLFAGGNNVTLSQSLNGASGTITISAANAAPAPVNISAGTTSNNLGSIVFSNSNGVSFGLNGSTITGSVAGGATVSTYNYPSEAFTTVGAPVAASYSVVPIPISVHLTGTAVEVLASINVGSVANNSSAAVVYSMSVVLHTRNAGTLNSVSSGTTQSTYTFSSNATGSVTGARYFTCPVNINATPGNYFAAIQLSTNSVGQTGAATTAIANTMTMIGIGTAQLGAMSVVPMGVVTNQTEGWLLRGINSSSGNITQISISNISQGGSNFQRAGILVRIRA